MAKYTITINTEDGSDRDVGIQYVAEKAGRETGEVLTSEQYLQRVLDNAVDSYAKEYVQSIIDEQIAPKFAKAPDATRNVVKSALASIQPPPEEDLSVKP